MKLMWVKRAWLFETTALWTMVSMLEKMMLGMRRRMMMRMRMRMFGEDEDDEDENEDNSEHLNT